MIRRSRNPAETEAVRLRVLHVTLEDPGRGLSDAAAVRTGVIARHLGPRYEMTVASARYVGGRRRTVDGVHHVLGGLPWGTRLRAVTWRLSLPLLVLRARPDLIVEDCAGPIPVAVVPWPLRRPTIAVVSDEPLGRTGQRMRALRPGRQVVATSAYLGAELRDLFPSVPVAVVPDALPEEAFVPRRAPRRHVIYFGPLDKAHGVDLLVAAWAKVAASSSAELLLMGDGPDEDLLRARVARLGLTSHVRFSGRVLPAARFDILAAAHVVLATGPHHSDAQLAAEALAVASPVVAFDQPAMREVVDATTGVLVPPGDTAAFAQAVLALLDDPIRARALGEAGPAHVADRRWEAVAPLEAAVYERATGRLPARRLNVAPTGGLTAPVPAGVAGLRTATGVTPGARGAGRPGRTTRPRHALAAILGLAAAGTLAGSTALNTVHPGVAARAVPPEQGVAATPVALATKATRAPTTTLPRPTTPAVDARTSPGRRAHERARRRAEAARRAHATRVAHTPATHIPANHTPATDTPATTTPPLSTLPASTTPATHPVSSTTSQATTAPVVTTPVSTVLTRHVTATLSCTASASVTISGSGGGINTLTVSGGGVRKSTTGGSVTLTLSVRAGTYSVIDQSTAGDPSMHWGWAPSTACAG